MGQIFTHPRYCYLCKSKGCTYKICYENVEIDDFIADHNSTPVDLHDLTAMHACLSFASTKLGEIHEQVGHVGCIQFYNKQGEVEVRMEQFICERCHPAQRKALSGLEGSWGFETFHDSRGYRRAELP